MRYRCDFRSCCLLGLALCWCAHIWMPTAGGVSRRGGAARRLGSQLRKEALVGSGTRVSQCGSRVDGGTLAAPRRFSCAAVTAAAEVVGAARPVSVGSRGLPAPSHPAAGEALGERTGPLLRRWGVPGVPAHAAGPGPSAGQGR